MDLEVLKSQLRARISKGDGDGMRELMSQASDQLTADQLEEIAVWGEKESRNHFRLAREEVARAFRPPEPEEDQEARQVEKLIRESSGGAPPPEPAARPVQRFTFAGREWEVVPAPPWMDRRLQALFDWGQALRGKSPPREEYVRWHPLLCRMTRKMVTPRGSWLRRALWRAKLLPNPFALADHHLLGALFATWVLETQHRGEELRRRITRRNLP
jgi:hypothetical protein